MAKNKSVVDEAAVHTAVSTTVRHKSFGNLSFRLLSIVCLVPAGLASIVSDHLVAANATHYIIVGRGPAGPALASRLSRNGYACVLTIEAGPDSRTDAVVDATQFQISASSSLDWACRTVDNRTIPGGKGCGEARQSTAKHGREARVLTTTPGELSKPEDTCLEWNWNGLPRYVKNVEIAIPPDTMQHAGTANILSDFHGSDRPINIGFLWEMFLGLSQLDYAEMV